VYDLHKRFRFPVAALHPCSVIISLGWLPLTTLDHHPTPSTLSLPAALEGISAANETEKQAYIDYLLQYRWGGASSTGCHNLFHSTAPPTSVPGIAAAAAAACVPGTAGLPSTSHVEMRKRFEHPTKHIHLNQQTQKQLPTALCATLCRSGAGRA